MIKKSYDTSIHCFRKPIENLFGVDDLEGLHTSRSDLLPTEELVFETESRTQYHNVFYNRLNSQDSWKDIKDTYHNFLDCVVRPIVKEEFVYQAFPTFRVQVPKEKAIHKWHYDSDIDHMHPSWEINFQIALTEMKNTTATWVESVPGLRDFAPMNMDYGEFYIFNGNKCMHGNKTNDSNKTRVSLDFRIIPLKKYKEIMNNELKSATTSRRFVVGEYYNGV